MSTGVQWYSMVQHAMVQHAMVHRPMFEPGGEMLCMGRTGPGYLALGPAPAQFWVEGHLVDTGHTLAHYTLPGHSDLTPSSYSSRDSVREAAVTRDILE